MKKIVILIILFLPYALLVGCGQDGPLYLPGQAKGIHKKDEFLLYPSQDDKQDTTSKQ